MADERAAALWSFEAPLQALERAAAAATALPGDATALQARYGAFEDNEAVGRFMGGVAGVQALGARLRDRGTPTSLQGAEPPEGLRAHLAWLAARVAESAGQLATPAQPVAAGGAERAARARWALAGAGAPAAAAEAMVECIEQTRAAFEPLRPSWLAALQAVHQSGLVNQANVAIGAAGARLRRHEEQAAHAARSAGGLHGLLHSRAAAHAQRALTEAIAADRAEIAGKQAFIDDAKALFTTDADVGPALADIDSRLRRLAKAYADAAERRRSLARLADAAQLADEGWVQQALDAATAASWWRDLAAAAERWLRDVPAAPERSR